MTKTNAKVPSTSDVDKRVGEKVPSTSDVEKRVGEKVPSTSDVDKRVGEKVPSSSDVEKRVGRKILIICEDRDNQKRTKLALGNQHDYHIVSTGKEGLQAIKGTPISMALIPIDLKDMDFTDFIRSAKQYSPVTLFALITNNILPDLSFLVTSNEIDAFTPEPLSVSSLIILRHTAIANRMKFKNRYHLEYSVA